MGSEIQSEWDLRVKTPDSEHRYSREFRGGNNIHGYPSDPPPPPNPSNQREKELVEIPNISNKPQLSEHVTPPTVNCESYTPPRFACPT